MNFEFLKNLNEFGQLYSFSKDAEDLVVSNPRLSCVSSRNALEVLVKSFYLARYGVIPSDSSLFELIDDFNFF